MNIVAQITIAGHNRASKNVHSINSIMVIKYHIIVGQIFV